MKKDEVVKKIKEIAIDSCEFVFGINSSLLFHDIIDKVDKIDIILNTNSSNLNSVDNSFLVVRYDVNSFNTIKIGDYNFLSLEDIYDFNNENNIIRDTKLVKKLELEICLKDNYFFERRLKASGNKFIAGIDEVGRGPLVGPVVAACVVLKDSFSLDGLTDSKK